MFSPVIYELLLSSFSSSPPHFPLQKQDILDSWERDDSVTLLTEVIGIPPYRKCLVRCTVRERSLSKLGVLMQQSISGGNRGKLLRLSVSRLHYTGRSVSIIHCYCPKRKARLKSPT